MASRPCLICGALSADSRCGIHRTRRAGPSSHARGLDRTHERLTRQTIEAHVATYGWVCPGYGVPAHPVAPGGLTGDHVLPRSTHPELVHEPSNYAVLCRPCNGRKGAR